MLIKNIFLIITGDKYPNGDAGAIREHSFAKIFQELGYFPIIIGMGETTNFKKKIYDEVTYYSMRYSNKNIVYRILGRVLFLYNTKKILKQLQLNEIKGILVVSGGKVVFEYFEKISKENNIQLFHDSVEWYSSTEFKRGEKDRAYKANQELNTEIINKNYKVFSISSYLEKFFSEKGIKTIRVPVIMDVQRIKHQKDMGKGEKIRIIYAGQVGEKDHLVEVVQAIEYLEKNNISKFQLRLIGITREQYENKFGKIKEELLNKSIYFMGRISREEVLNELSKAHFTVLLRPENERYAKAGFPTKVVESLSTATPVICNYTSDLNLYLRDRYNAIILDGCSEDACIKGLERILKLSKMELETMQGNARKSAEKYFDYRKYRKKFFDFVKGVK